MTWAFVGRWWEAPPWPLVLNAKQRCHCLASAAADACAGCFSGNQEQKQTAPPPPALHTYAPLQPASLNPPVQLRTRTNTHSNILPSGNSHTSGDQARRDITCSHTADLRGLERVRGQTSGDTQEGQFSCRHENQMQCCLKQGPGTIRGTLEITERYQDKASCEFILF